MPYSTPNPATAPIGLFDSGVGGLSVYVHLRQKLPYEQFIYYADTKNVPYGNKSSRDILALTETAVAWLVAQGAKLVVVACNSASAHALDVLRQKYHIPIVGLVPAIKPAALHTKSKKIAVLATQATLTGRLLTEVIDTVATPLGIQVYKHFEPNLVPWVEMGAPINHHVAELLIKQMYAWIKEGVDTLVLGCTHYPFFRPFLQAEIDKHALTMTLIDSGLAIAERVASLLTHHHTLAPTCALSSPLRFFASGDDIPVHTVQRLIHLPVIFVDKDNTPLFPPYAL